MKNIWTQFSVAVITALLFLATLALNQWIFSELEFVRGVNWIYLPAGVRLLCTLLFAEAGVVGLFVVSWLVCNFYFFPDDGLRALAGGIMATLAPYGTYCAARKWMGLGRSLSDLTPRRLLWLSVIYGLSNALLHQAWSVVIGDGFQLDELLVMILGDFSGTLIVLYVFKALLMLPIKTDRYLLK